MKAHFLEVRHQEHLRKLGVREIPDRIDMHDAEYEEHHAAWRRTLPDASPDLLHMKVLGHAAWIRHGMPAPLKKKNHMLGLRWILGLLAALLVLLIIHPKAHAQFSHINTITTKQGGSTVGFHAAPFTLNCGANLTCTDDGSTFNLVAGSGGTVSWDAILNPTTGGLSIQQFANGNAFFTVKRKTDTSPTGSFFDYQNAAGATLCKLDITGTFSSCSYPYAGLTGTPTLAQTIANATHKWLNSYNATTGVFTQTQVFSTDLSDFSTTAPAANGNIPIYDTSAPNAAGGTGAYVPGDPLVQGVFADLSTSVAAPVVIGGYDTAGTPVLHRAIFQSSTPGASDFGLVVRNIPSGTQNVALAAETTKTIGTVRLQGNSGGILDAVGQNVAVPANWLASGCAFFTAPTTLTSGNGSYFNCDASGNLLVKLGANPTITNAFLLDSTFTGRINTQGQKAMSASTPVVLASDQASIPVAATLAAETSKVIGTVNQGAANTLANAWPAKITDGTNSMPTGDSSARSIHTTIDNAAVPVSEKAATSTSVTLQNAAVATGNGTVLTVDGMGIATLTVNCASCSGGTTITFEGSEDTTNFGPLGGQVLSGTGSLTSTTTASGIFVWQFQVAGLQQIRARISTYSAGTITVTGHTSAIAYGPQVRALNTSADFVSIGAVPSLSKGTQGSTGFMTQDLHDAGRTIVTYTADAVTPAASDTLVTFAKLVGDTVTSGVTTTTITAAKTFRITGLAIQFTSSTTTANKVRLRLRSNASAACTASSNIVGTWELALPLGTLAANQGQAVLPVDFPEGLEFSPGAGRQMCISAIAAAANGTLSFTLSGYEY